MLVTIKSPYRRKNLEPGDIIKVRSSLSLLVITFLISCACLIIPFMSKVLCQDDLIEFDRKCDNATLSKKYLASKQNSDYVLIPRDRSVPACYCLYCTLAKTYNEEQCLESKCITADRAVITIKATIKYVNQWGNWWCYSWHRFRL